MSRRPILLDTHAAIWMALPEALAKSAEAELHEARSHGVAVVVSPITAWEVGLLVARVHDDVRAWDRPSDHAPVSADLVL